MAEGDTLIMTRGGTQATVGAAASQRPQAVIPRRLGAVNLVKQIGQGGMGVVWMGRHELLGRDVAVKFLLNVDAAEDDPGFATFIEGARAAAAVRHDGLNAVLHADVVDGVPFLVMEYVEGPTLAELIKSTGRLPLAVCRVVLDAVCTAVAELHDHNIIHRDIKPSNILLTRDGKVVITDFGLACARQAHLMGSAVAGVAGTPVYMAPEMFDRSVSVRSDVYAIGIMAFELLCGRPPFEGGVEELRTGHQSLPLPPEALATLIPDLAQVVERACEKNVMFRYKSGRHLQRAFEEAFAACDQSIANKAKGEAELAQRIGQWFRGDAAETAAAAETTQSGNTYYERLDNFVQLKKKKLGDPESDSGVSGSGSDLLLDVVKDSLPCMRCGAELKGQPLTGRCPSCLLLVSLTLNPSRMMEGPPPAPAPQPAGESAATTGAGAAAEQPRPTQEPKKRGVIAGVAAFWRGLFDAGKR